MQDGRSELSAVRAKRSDGRRGNRRKSDDATDVQMMTVRDEQTTATDHRADDLARRLDAGRRHRHADATKMTGRLLGPTRGLQAASTTARLR